MSCYIPPAYVVSEDLRINGGVVKFSISSNGQDFSNTFNFRYLPSVILADINPKFVLLDQSLEIKLTGNNF